MFEVYTKEIEIQGNKYNIKPLTGKYIGLLYDVIKELNVGENGKQEEIVDKLSSVVITKLHTICLETMKKSYPDQEEGKLNEWVSQNLFSLVKPIVEVNISANNIQQ